jgi:hypothetical protein
MGEPFTLIKISLFRLIEETCVSLQGKPNMLERGESVIFFPYEN